MARRRGLTEHDLAVWDAFARQVRALPGRRVPAPEEPGPPPAVADRPQQPPPARARPAALGRVVIDEQPAGVDNATWRRLRTGRRSIERSLDLHGHTAQRAYVALELLLRGARADGVRVVEVITGRGAGETGGVLKREMPLWLNLPHLRPMILAAVHPTRNTGSVRLLLRR